jgi:ABC-type oligopeptide transport system substrate-binding subunit
MRQFFLLIILFLLAALYIITSCTTKVVDDPLIVPPNFAELPDPKNPEKQSDQQKDADVARLKDLLLKSE